ncbi:MAG: hypothetical protein KIT25_03700 [Enhydrobacter sp.]|nr:MAG: hypothetical protein KIT25_03700 [Enhydrobacter sp.]
MAASGRIFEQGTVGSPLTDVQIEELVGAHNLISHFDAKLLSGCSYDLRVGSALKSRNRQTSFDLLKADYIVESGECITINSLEEIDFRSVLLFGYIANKHSIVATGLFHPITTIDPGFQGPLALSFMNLGNVRIRIRHGQPIAKLICVPLWSRPTRIYGVSQNPSYREGSTDIALVVDKPEHRDVDTELSNMYGQPIRRLYEHVGALSKQLEVSELKTFQKAVLRRREIVIAVIAATLGGLVGTASMITWELAKPAIGVHAVETPAPSAAPKVPSKSTP